MPLPVPPALERAAAYAPLLLLLRDSLIKPKDLAERWGFSHDHLANLRKRRVGPPWIRLPTSSGQAKRPMGSIRYRISDIIGAELAGSGGALTLERVALAVAAMDFLTEQERAAVISRLRTALG